MTQSKNTTPDLDQFFEAAKQQSAAPVSDDLMARIMADAKASVPKPAARQVAPKQGWFQGAFSAIGGWPAAAAFAACTVCGVGVGAAIPLADYLSASTQVATEDSESGIFDYSELVTDINALWTEG